MAYSGKISVTGFAQAFTEILRFVTGDSTTPGRDWQIVHSEVDTQDTNFDYITFSGSITIYALDTWYDLPVGCITDYNFSVGTISLTEGVDYQVDWLLGRVKFLSGINTISSLLNTTTGTVVTYSVNFRRVQIVLNNTGISGTESINVGMLLCSAGYGKANVLLKTYKMFIPGYTNFFDTTVGNPNNVTSDGTFQSAFGMWNGYMDMWIFSSKQRIIIVVRSDTYYSFAYIGKFFPFGSPAEYPYPYTCIGDLNICYSNVANTYIKWYDSTDTNRHFIAKAYFGTIGYYNNQLINVDGSWIRNATLSPTTNNTAHWLTIDYISGYSPVIFPIYITYNNQVLGEFESCYFTPYVGITTESIITIGTDTYIVFQDCFRNTYDSYMAIKCE